MGEKSAPPDFRGGRWCCLDKENEDMKERMIKVAFMIGYLLFFILMDFWIVSIQNSFYTTELLSDGFYVDRYWLVTFISFFKWFVLGFLLNFMSNIKKTKFNIDISYLGIALASLVICLLIRLTLIPVPMMIYGNGYLMAQLYSFVPIFPGFFMFEAFFSE